MKTLSFLIGENRYAIPARQVIEIIPWVMLRKLPHAPEYVAGLLNYRGIPVPVIDLTGLMLGCPSRQMLSTRIVLVDYPGKKDTPHILGILAEGIGVTDGLEERVFADAGITVKNAPYLGGLSIDDQQTIQMVQIEQLLTDSLRESLFSEQETPVP